MASTFDLEFRGRPGPDVTAPGPVGALGMTGLDGRPGVVKGWLVKTCSSPATDGHDGTAGSTPPQATGGGPGEDVPAVTVRCASLAGPPLRLLFQAGNGGAGGAGGPGGDGGAGGDAGTQPAVCAHQHGATTGGTGGGAGNGGRGGDAGNGGSVGPITITSDASIPQPFADAQVVAGDPGALGAGGEPGHPGAGGLNGDGSTRAPDGALGTKGGFGAPGSNGSGPGVTSTTSTSPTDQLVIVVEPVA